MYEMIYKYKDANWLHEQYITNGRTVKSIQEECGVFHHSVERYLKRYNIRKRPSIIIYPTEDELRDLHHVKKYGIRKIANMYPGVGVDMISRLANEYNISILDKYELVRRWWSDEANKKTMGDISKRLWKDNDYRTRTSTASVTVPASYWQAATPA